MVVCIFDSQIAPNPVLTAANARSHRELSRSSLKTEKGSLSVDLRAFHSENRNLVQMLYITFYVMGYLCVGFIETQA